MAAQATGMACIVVLAGRPARDASGVGILLNDTVDVHTARPQVDVFPGWPQTPLSGDGWRVVHQLSAHYMLVIDVETYRVREVLRIAHTLLDPLKET